MQKIRYEVDPHNRLIVKRTRRKTRIKRFRKVYDGRFKLNKANFFTYHIKAPGQDIDAPHQVKLKGKWSLTKNHDLRFTLDKWKRQTFGDQLTIKGDIIDIGKNFLLFAVTTKTKQNQDLVYILKFQGSWQADKYNRLTFKIKKERSRYDTFIFRGRWEINKNHQIIYQYEKAQLIRKLKQIHTLIFKGYWDIEDRARISYILDRDTNSLFNFRASLGIFKNRYIKYELGTDLQNRARPSKKTILLFGTWKIKKNKGLTFEIQYGDKKIHCISFGTDARLAGRDSVLFRLKNDRVNKNIGVDIKLSHKMLKGDGEAFLRVLKSRRESGVFVGAGKRW